MTCKTWDPELVERARRGEPAGQEFRHHLAGCPGCRERWESELQLSRDLRGLRGTMGELRSGADARAQLMSAFAARRKVVVMQRGLAWAAAAMIAFVLAGVWNQVHWPGRAPVARILQAELYQTGGDDADLLAENEFIPVPYAPPLAQGERVEVVRAELTPAALVRMGFVVRPGTSIEVTTDLMMGEDGMPRAVRVPESVGIRY